MNNKKGKKRPFSFPAVILLIIIFVMSTFFLVFGCEETPQVDSSNESNDGTADSSDTNNSEPQESQTTEETGVEEEEKTDVADELIEEESSDGQEATEEQSDEAASEDNSEVVSIDIYYADSQVEYLVGEKRLVGSDNKFVNAILELIKPPEGTDLVGLVPASTVINKIIVRDNIADVDLSANFIDDRFDSGTVDILLVYSIVNTLTGFTEVDAVIFFVNGEKLKNLGSLDVEGPIFRRNDLIKN